MSGRSYGQFCALTQALDRVGERWTLLIIRELLAGPARFRELRDALPGLASNLLTQRLRGMEKDGLVAQRVLPSPAGVNVYELTEQGRALEPSLMALSRWGAQFMASSRYSDPGGPRGLLMALRLVLPAQADADRPCCIALQVGADALGISINQRGQVTVSLEAPPSPELTLKLPYRRAFALLLGSLDVRQGVEKGLIKATGSLAPLAVLDELLRRRKVLINDCNEEGTPSD